MEEKELKKLFNSLSLKEKIGQLIVLGGQFFGDDDVVTGLTAKWGFPKEMLKYVGSTMNVFGAKKTIDIQKRYLEKSKHKIPLLFMADVVYGYHTIMPIPLGQGASWNPNLVQKNYSNIATEASKAGIDVTFSPMVDLVRDARWGRCLESPGEDPYLNSQFAKAWVKGFQGNLTKNDMAACVKHFAAYGAAEAGREYNTVDMSRWRLFQDYLPSYKAAIEAGVKMVMTSFNTLDGIPATANKWLMRKVLREKWGFDGVLISDHSAIKELIAHGIAKDNRQASKLALEAGCDIDMMDNCYATELRPLLDDGKISDKLIDEAVWRVLKLKNDLGLFEHPYRGKDLEEDKYSHTSVHQAKALDLARQSIVLLQNNNHVLPLNVSNQKIAIIGPYSQSTSLTGLWALTAKSEDVTSIKDAFDKANVKAKFAEGSHIVNDYSSFGVFGKHAEANADTRTQVELTQEGLKVAKNSDVVILTLGEHVLQSGEAGSRTHLRLPEPQEELLNEISKLGKKVILVVFSGRPLVLTEYTNKVDAIIQAWFPGTEGGQAIYDILTGNYNPSGRLSISFPQTEGQCPIYYSQFNTGRPLEGANPDNRFISKYQGAPNKPLYPFGYGLSYTKYAYHDLTLDKHELKKNSHITVKVTVENIGAVTGVETVQLYIQDKVGSVVRPVKELKGFKKVKLEPGQKKVVSFEINDEMLKFWTADLEYKSEPGEFNVFVGHSSEENLIDNFVLMNE